MSTKSLNETRRIYSKSSIYYDTPIRNRNFLSFYSDRSIGFSNDDDFIELDSRHEGRPDVLSYDLYGEERYWWVIVRLNMDTIIDPIRDFKQGVVLRVPTKERLLRNIT